MSASISISQQHPRRRARLCLLRLSALFVAPLTMAPLCQGIHPSFPTNPVPPTPEQWAETRLINAHADSVLVLGISDWAAVEPCNECIGTDCSSTPAPVGWPSSATHTKTDKYGISWKCAYNFQLLDAYLDTHADPSTSRPVRRHFMVQLAPLFYDTRRTPQYLAGKHFDHSDVIAAYQDLWDNLRPVLVQHIADVGDPWVAVALGNEVNEYINHTHQDPALTWTQYSEFVNQASAHIKNNLTGMPGTVVTVSTECFGSCGLCETDPSCDDRQFAALGLMAQTDVLTMTYYPYFADGQQGSLTSSQLSSKMFTDFYNMSQVSQSLSKVWLIQEAGHPTAGANASQDDFVDYLFAYWNLFQDQISGVNYYYLTDVSQGPGAFIPNGFFDEHGTVKNSNSWSTFKNYMGAVSP